MDMKEFFRLAEAPLRTFEDFATHAGLTSERGQSAADHIGWKCGCNNEYEKMRRMFEQDSRFIYQSMVSGRRIAIIRLAQGIPTSLGAMHVVELSDQKPDGSQRSGFDHVEIRSLWGKDGARELAQRIVARGFVCAKVMRPHHVTHDIEMVRLDDSRLLFKVRIEDEALLDKIRRDEML